MSIKLHCFGTAGYHPNERRHTSSYFLPQQGIALDAGSGFFRCFPFIQTPELHVLLSHCHLDHVIGLTFLWNAYRNQSLKQVHVHAEADKLAAIQDHLFSDLIFPALPNIVWHPIQPNESLVLNGSVIKTFELEHPGGSLGFVIETDGHKLAYVTDTTTCENRRYWSVVKNVDLLLHECNFGAAQSEFAARTGHSDFGSLFRALVKHKVRRVLLTHFDTFDDDLVDEVARSLESHKASDPLEILLAQDGMSVEY